VRYGFIIDNRKCIGCHACTVACKTENRVPLGVNRTWVKCVEKGRFPHVRRFFQVNRCNHCDRPPCVEICPVNAMYRRKDGIVDFNSAKCMGCQACVQACPYDAIYIDPDRHTAAKCHFCAHRIDAGLEPACVAVCPQRAIIAGDIDEPESEVARLLARQTVQVRKPEQRTRPKLYYIDADRCTLIPTAARHESMYMWAERDQRIQGGGASILPDSPFLQRDVLAAYDVAHARPWGWQVPVYFWFKSIGSGLLALPAIGMALGILPANRSRDIVLSTLALVLIAATVVMLVSDLSLKHRFFKVLASPPHRSWVSRGAFLLVLYTILCAAFWVGAVAGLPGLSAGLLWPTVPAGMLTAAYTAFLFGQCEGRDLWQTPLLPAHLVVQTLLAGAAVLALLPGSMDPSGRSHTLATAGLSICLVCHLLVVLGETALPRTSENAAYAMRLITHGPYRKLFWAGAVVFGGLFPLLLLFAGGGGVGPARLAGLLALGGLLASEWCIVMAGQRVPNS
jgi:Fe-S-cluster-containing dehydrogenase component/formate-dependent nitrite reductase membrane component NrfD